MIIDRFHDQTVSIGTRERGSSSSRKCTNRHAPRKVVQMRVLPIDSNQSACRSHVKVARNGHDNRDLSKFFQR
jgi:hypothetical protein